MKNSVKNLDSQKKRSLDSMKKSRFAMSPSISRFAIISTIAFSMGLHFDTIAQTSAPQSQSKQTSKPKQAEQKKKKSAVVLPPLDGELDTVDGKGQASPGQFISTANKTDFSSVRELETEIPQDLYEPLVLTHNALTGQPCLKGSLYRKVEGMNDPNYKPPVNTGSSLYVPRPEIVTIKFKKCVLKDITLSARPKSVSGTLTVHYFINKSQPQGDPLAVSVLSMFNELEISEGLTGVRYNGNLNIDTEIRTPKIGAPIKSFKGMDLEPTGEYEGAIPSIGVYYRMGAKDLKLAPFMDTSKAEPSLESHEIAHVTPLFSHPDDKHFALYMKK